MLWVLYALQLVVVTTKLLTRLILQSGDNADGFYWMVRTRWGPTSYVVRARCART